MQGKVEIPDIIHTLIEDYNSLPATKKGGEALHMMKGDSRLIIIAGSDTTAATLVHLFYRLASNPEVVAKLRQELNQCVGDEQHIQHHKIQGRPS